MTTLEKLQAAVGSKEAWTDYTETPAPGCLFDPRERCYDSSFYADAFIQRPLNKDPLSPKVAYVASPLFTDFSKQSFLWKSIELTGVKVEKYLLCDNKSSGAFRFIIQKSSL